MSERTGWWRFHRKIWDNPYMDRPAYFAVWCWLLSEAQWQEGKRVIFGGEPITLKAGQLTCGRKQISKATGVPSGTVYRILESFKIEQQIEQRSDRQKSLITIVKWLDYQGSEQESEQRVSNERATSEQRMSTTEEVKKVKKKRNIQAEQDFEKFWSTYDKKVSRSKAEKKFLRLSADTRSKILAHVPRYVESVPEKQYRKNPLTYLNQESWNDEIIRRTPDNEQKKYRNEQHDGPIESTEQIMQRKKKQLERQKAIAECGKCENGWIKKNNAMAQCSCVYKLNANTD